MIALVTLGHLLYLDNKLFLIELNVLFSLLQLVNTSYLEYYINECQFSVFEGLPIIFEGSLNASNSIPSLIFVPIDADACTLKLQHANKVRNFYIETMMYFCLLQ